MSFTAFPGREFWRKEFTLRSFFFLSGEELMLNKSLLLNMSLLTYICVEYEFVVE